MTATTPLTPRRTRAVVGAVLVLALTSATLSSAAPLARADDPSLPVSVSPRAYVDAESGRTISQLDPERPFRVRYALESRYPYPVLVRSVTGDFGHPPRCPLASIAPVSAPPPVVLEPGDGTVLADDATSWQRTGECLDTVFWRATEVEAERVPTTVDVQGADHRWGETAELRAEVGSEWMTVTTGEVEFLIDGRPVGRTEVEAGKAMLSLPAESVADGPHRLSGRYLPGASGPAASVSAVERFSVTTVERRSVTTVDVSNHTFGEASTLRAEVEPASAAGEVVFSLDDDPVGEPVPVRDGVALLPVEDVGVGSHRVAARFTSRQVHVAGSTSAATELVVAQAPTTVSAEVADEQVEAGATVTVSGRVEIANDHRVPDDVEVSVLDAAGHTLGATQPASDGRYDVEVEIPSSAEERFTLYVSYAGTSTLGGSLVERSVRVGAAPRSPEPAEPTASADAPTPDRNPGRPGSPDDTPSPTPVAAPDDVRPASPATGGPSPLPLAVGVLMLVAGGLVLRRRLAPPTG